MDTIVSAQWTSPLGRSQKEDKEDCIILPTDDDGLHEVVWDATGDQWFATPRSWVKL